MADEVKVYACELCGALYRDEKTADACARLGVRPAIRAYVPGSGEFDTAQEEITVGGFYLAVRSGMRSAVPVKIVDKFQSAHNKHETHYNAVTVKGRPLNLNGWWLVAVDVDGPMFEHFEEDKICYTCDKKIEGDPHAENLGGKYFCSEGCWVDYKRREGLS